MRILFLTLYPEPAASPRYRVTQFLPYLRQHGVECTVAEAVSPEVYTRSLDPARRGRAWRYHAHETLRRVSQLLRARRYDVVFVQKTLLSAPLRGLSRLLEARAKTFVYDLDDAVHLAPPHRLPARWSFLEDPEQIKRLFQSAALVLAGNRWLADAAHEAGAARVEEFPTVVDTDRFRPSPLPATYCVGWIGGPSTTPHLEIAAQALNRLQGARLCFVGADPARNPCPSAKLRTWSLGREVVDLQGFSAGIMPLPDTDWVRGKCGLKALQYMACGRPCVASPVGVVSDMIADGHDGYWAASPEEWEEKLGRLCDPKLCGDMGRAARATVEARYALKTAAPRLLELLESIR